MKFLHPNILYFLFLLAIPIIIHLFNFRRYKRVYFPSLLFIKKVEKESNSTRNLRQYLILACRILAFASLIFAFAQPYFPDTSKNDSLGNVIPIYLDNSFSMAAKGNNGDLLNQAKETVLKIIENYPKEQRYIFVTNNLDGAELRPINQSELKDKLDDLQLSPIHRALTNPLSSINEHIQSTEQKKGLHYFVISDFQSQNFNDNEVIIDTTSSYSLLQLHPQITHNIYIDSVWFEQPFQRENVNNTLYARIYNTSNEPLANVEVNLEIGDTKRQTLVDLQPNNSNVISLNYTDKSTGIKSGKIEVLDENLYFDNHFYFSYEVKESINILIINDTESLPFPSLVYETDDYYNVQETSIHQLKIEELNKTDLIVLNEVKSVSSGINTQLKQLVEQGTHLLIIPPHNFDKNAYNNLLSTFQMPLLNQAVSSELRIGEIHTEYVFFNGMFDKEITALRMPPLKKYLSSTIYSNANFNQLIQYENGMPFFVENAQFQNVFALYSPINSEFNDFGKTALFTSLLLRVGEMSQGKAPLQLTIGSSDDYVLRKSLASDHSLRLKQGEIEFIPEFSRSTSSTTLSIRHSIDNQSIQDGIYSIISDDQKLGELALNFNRIESEMEYFNTEEIRNYFNSLGVQNINVKDIDTVTDIYQLSVNNPTELWRILLILCIGFILCEIAILTFWKA